MYIKLIDTRSGTHGEVLCDVCAQPIDLDEDCETLRQKISIGAEPNIAHRICALRPGRFDNAWSQVTKPRRILQSITEQHRHPVITEFLKQFNKG